MNAALFEIPDKPHGIRRPKAPIRVLLIGGSTLFRAGLHGLIEKWEGIEIAAEVSNPAEWLAQPDGLSPDVVLLDIDSKPDVALQLLEHARGGDGTTPVLILTSRWEPELRQHMVLAGARGVVSKDKSLEHLLTAIRKVHEGELWVDRATTAQLIADMAARRRQEAADPERARIQSLTSREREVIELVGQGLSNKRIAARMGVSEHTVRHHLTSIFAKLGLPDRLALVVYVFRHDLSQQTR